MSNGTGTSLPSPVKDAIDANSGRFEFLKQSLTLGLAGIGGVAALFTDPSRIPADNLSKILLLVAGAGLLFVVAFAIMGLSTYANLLMVTAKNPLDQNEVKKFTKGVRNHARVVIISLFAALVGTVCFAGIRLFASSTSPDGAVSIAADFVAKQTKLTTDRIHFSRMEAENDGYVVTFAVPTTSSDMTVRVSTKDGTITQVAQQKTP